MSPVSTDVTSNHNRIKWHVVIHSLGLEEGYTMQHCTILLYVTSRTGFTSHSLHTFIIL
jgi:hypothetical protein